MQRFVIIRLDTGPQHLHRIFRLQYRLQFLYRRRLPTDVLVWQLLS